MANLLSRMVRLLGERSKPLLSQMLSFRINDLLCGWVSFCNETKPIEWVLKRELAVSGWKLYGRWASPKADVSTCLS